MTRADASADPVWQLHLGEGPMIAAAIHNDYAARDEVTSLLRLDRATRLREEDPFTGDWTEVVATRVVGRRSRFEVDLNLPVRLPSGTMSSCRLPRICAFLFPTSCLST